MTAISSDLYSRLEVIYGGVHKTRPADIIDVAEFIGIKSNRAKGKRITTFEVSKLRFVEPLVPETPEEPQGPEVAEELEPEGAEANIQEFDSPQYITDAESPVEEITEDIQVVKWTETASKESKKPATETATGTTVAERVVTATESPVAEIETAKPVGEERVEKIAREAGTRKPAVKTRKAATETDNRAESVESAESRPPHKSTVIAVDEELIIEQSEDDDDTRNPDIQQLNLF